MPKDYAKRAEPRGRKKQSEPEHPAMWKWLLPLFLLIVVIVGLFYLKYHNHIVGADTNHISPSYQLDNGEQHEKQGEQKPAPVEEAQPKFEFYNMLPKMHVNVEGETPQQVAAEQGQDAQAQTPAQQPTTVQPGTTQPTQPQLTSDHTQFVLQIAAFRDRADAENMVQRFSEFKLDLHVKSFNDGKITWYRVQAGPFANIQQAKQSQSILKQSNVDSILRKI
tara:strand:- start:3250 stop:3915 length:666 start_codon:yes stop_codon:yes gene_type:complete